MKTSFCGAGILPYCFAGEPYFLLGQENYGVYADFGGRPEKGEDPVACAKRECREELGQEITWNDRVVQLKIAKKKFGPYHLFLVPVKEAAWQHKDRSCQCLTCSFTPNNEKTAVGWFPSNAVYEAVYNGSGIMRINGQEYRLRSAFIDEIKQLPGYQTFTERVSRMGSEEAALLNEASSHLQTCCRT